jgi:hypothetical protein
MRVAKKDPDTLWRRGRAESSEAGNLSAKYSTGKALRRRTPRRGTIRLYPVEPMHVEALRARGIEPTYIGHGLYVLWESVPEEAKVVADA